ncbi:unnamed protein product [Arctogadus glacialis]
MVLARCAWPSCSPTDKQTSPKETLEHGARWQAVDSSVFSQMHSCPSQPCALGGPHWEGPSSRLGGPQQWTGRAPAVDWEGPSSKLGGPQQGLH